MITDADAARFWSKVDKRGDNECWPWLASTDGRYGVMSINNQRMKATRVAYHLLKGLVPEGKVVCHACDNPICVNPAHLWIGSQKENMRDSLAKGRHQGKLTLDQARAIRSDTRTTSIIAAEFGIDRTMVQQIRRGQAWTM